LEGALISRIVRARLGIPVVEIEVPPISDSIEPGVRTRLEALVETARERMAPGAGAGRTGCQCRQSDL
jgi:hypothetical protein